MTSKRKTFSLALAMTAMTALTACQTTSEQQRTDKIDAVLERAAAEAYYKGQTEDSLALLERMYKRNSGNMETAFKYARALREYGYYNRASLVLSPFIEGNDSDPEPILTEYAALQSAMGRYKDAEATARRAVLKDPDSGKAYHVLGIALDAQGYHDQAEVAFRKGLDMWQGDPSSILNNLGLNLAAQGFLDEAIEVLRKAQAANPDRKEIERNLRIVSSLQYTPPRAGTRLVPKPPRLPDRRLPMPEEKVLKDHSLYEDTAIPEDVLKDSAAATSEATANEGSEELEEVEVEAVEAKPVATSDAQNETDTSDNESESTNSASRNLND